MRRIGVMVMMVAALVACKKESSEPDEPVETPLEIPDTYSFNNVSYSGQTDRLNQLEEMTAYMKTANEEGVEIDAGVLQAMFANTGENGGGNFTFSSSKQLKDKCFSPDVAMFEGYFTQMETASKSTTPASNGTAGVMYNEDNSKSILFDANGWEYTQLIEKGLMGAVFYYQATSVYMGSDKMNADNETVEEGKGTAMQHHWDEAYGYLGVGTDFPENTEDVRFWGKYTVGRDAVLGSAEALSSAMRKGRAAINAERYDDRDEAISEARAEWERVCAGTAIHYLNGALDNIGNDFERNHELSEAWAFIGNLLYNEERRISQDEIDEIRLEHIGENFYEVTSSGLQAARDKLAEIYELEDVKTLL